MTISFQLLAQLVLAYATLLDGFRCADDVYTHTWAVRVPAGELVASDVANKHGFEYVGRILTDSDYYLFRHRRLSKRSAEPGISVMRNLTAEPEVHWSEQQLAKRRSKRSVGNFNDPKWPRMWYLTREDGLDMGVRRAWSHGMSGKGVVVTILDDGIEKNHPDLQKNYDPDASFDVNSHDSDPQPRYDYTNENKHGTRCAGEVAAEANNNVCNVGIAFDARIGGVRMLDGDVTDAVEAMSLSLNPQHIDIYSASWGPDDDGRTVDGPALLARQAFYDGVTRGRRGLGSIFVWASGNGGREGDNCNCDGYTNSIYTLSISSATETGGVPWYSEACSSTLATTYSSGGGSEGQIVTTDLRKLCTEKHTGTSASAPLAAAICALALQANSRLTWRDMQHIVVRTARPHGLKADDWTTNGVGRRVSHSFGYGLMDAEAMVLAALNWTTVPLAHRCEVTFRDASRGLLVSGIRKVVMETDGCRGTPYEVRYLEHVQAVVTVTSTRRGELEMFLTSPMGTRSTLVARRLRDTSTDGFTNWAFMTTHCWGETAAGVWTLEIHNGMGLMTTLKSWSLVLHGTTVPPTQTHMRDVDARLSSDRGQPRRAVGDHHYGNSYHDDPWLAVKSQASVTSESVFPALLFCSLLASCVSLRLP